MHTVQTDHAPLPLGHYSQAIVHAGLVFVSGQLPIDPATGAAAGAGIEEQTEQALANVAAILDAAGSGLDRVLKVTIYIADMALWGRANAVYARVLGEHRPARAVVPTLPLHHDYMVEIEAVAALESAG
jgi:2-iminobutanoate/2-iminopropanoate deaminase